MLGRDEPLGLRKVVADAKREMRPAAGQPMAAARLAELVLGSRGFLADLVAGVLLGQELLA